MKNNSYNSDNNLEEIRERGSMTSQTNQNKSEVELIANQNFIQLLSVESKKIKEKDIIDKLILYKNLVIFAFDKTENYVLFNYTTDLEDESFQIKFFPQETIKSNFNKK